MGPPRSRSPAHIGPIGPSDGADGSTLPAFQRKEVDQTGNYGKPSRWLITCGFTILVVSVAAWVGYRTWPRKLTIVLSPRLPTPSFRSGRLTVQAPSDVLLGEVGTFRDELRAYLYFEYLKSLKSVDEHEVLLTVTEDQVGPLYRLDIAVLHDLLTAVPYLADLQAKRFISAFDLDFVSDNQLAYKRQQTEIFEAAYNAPIRRKLEKLSPSELVTPLVHFMIFKSKTDRRVREGIEPVPMPLSSQRAHELAADIITVAQFYSLPLDLFLGIGAMENNYMNVNGDLRHVVWKKRAQKGDIVLKRRHGRVLVSDFSVGLWQVTLETLRYAHKLYLQDRKKRDYTALPGRLQPSSDLDVDLTRPEVLTTYAGLLFRDLLDRFGGDVVKAVGAYNGGPHPNLKYAAGVQLVAEYARKILEHAGILNGEALARTRLVIRSRLRG